MKTDEPDEETFNKTDESELNSLKSDLDDSKSQIR